MFMLVNAWDGWDSESYAPPPYILRHCKVIIFHGSAGLKKREYVAEISRLTLADTVGFWLQLWINSTAPRALVMLGILACLALSHSCSALSHLPRRWCHFCPSIVLEIGQLVRLNCLIRRKEDFEIVDCSAQVNFHHPYNNLHLYLRDKLGIRSLTAR
ncbi:hypothetical protein BJY01DRAFT_222594 [Aspergillus pseudoustus]|uniref:Uncharacterized protein n=1 Tax=Aspergillus pseudoustus TaxID=1810923 RepID=A0ABR4J7P4_9EURO